MEIRKSSDLKNLKIKTKADLLKTYEYACIGIQKAVDSVNIRSSFEIDDESCNLNFEDIDDVRNSLLPSTKIKNYTILLFIKNKKSEQKVASVIISKLSFKDSAYISTVAYDKVTLENIELDVIDSLNNMEQISKNINENTANSQTDANQRTKKQFYKSGTFWTAAGAIISLMAFLIMFFYK